MSALGQRPPGVPPLALGKLRCDSGAGGGGSSSSSASSMGAGGTTISSGPCGFRGKAPPFQGAPGRKVPPLQLGGTRGSDVGGLAEGTVVWPLPPAMASPRSNTTQQQEQQRLGGPTEGFRTAIPEHQLQMDSTARTVTSNRISEGTTSSSCSSCSTTRSNSLERKPPPVLESSETRTLTRTPSGLLIGTPVFGGPTVPAPGHGGISGERALFNAPGSNASPAYRSAAGVMDKRINRVCGLIDRMQHCLHLQDLAIRGVADVPKTRQIQHGRRMQDLAMRGSTVPGDRQELERENLIVPDSSDDSSCVSSLQGHSAPLSAR